MALKPQELMLEMESFLKANQSPEALCDALQEALDRCKVRSVHLFYHLDYSQLMLA